jgi:hypothetical protein
MTCYCDYDAPEFFREVTPRAVFKHKCSECGRVIQKGERYKRILGKWDGHFSTFNRCHHCDSVATELAARIPCYCDMYGGLWDGDRLLDYMADLREAGTGDYFAVGRLMVAARRAMREGRSAA